MNDIRNLFTAAKIQTWIPGLKMSMPFAKNYILRRNSDSTLTRKMYLQFRFLIFKD